MLFFENGLLDRGHAYYLDDNGYGASSNIVAKGYNNKSYDSNYVQEVFSYLSSLKWPIEVGPQTNGPIMVALQSRKNEDEELAYWINAYNAYTVKLIIDNYPLSSITNLEGGKPWDKKWIKLGSKTYSLNNIENDIIMTSFTACCGQVCPKVSGNRENRLDPESTCPWASENSKTKIFQLATHFIKKFLNFFLNFF